MMVATLPGEQRSRAFGFTPDQRTSLSLSDGVEAPVIYLSHPMVLPAAADVEL